MSIYSYNITKAERTGMNKVAFYRSHFEPSPHPPSLRVDESPEPVSKRAACQCQAPRVGRRCKHSEFQKYSTSVSEEIQKSLREVNGSLDERSARSDASGDRSEV